mgnify:CR=1 FL=1
MVNVALATAAAPTYFRPLEHGGYVLVDGGVWANNPVMLAVIEAMTAFNVDQTQIDVLSIGCGDDPYKVSRAQVRWGGKLFWCDTLFAAMHLQSLSVVNQARLLLSPPNVIRIDAPTNEHKLALDDWKRAVEQLVPEGQAAAEAHRAAIADKFMRQPADVFVPSPIR